MSYPIAQASRLGAREVNEDRIGHWSAPEAVLLAVADGLGGHLNGEVAAQLALDVLGDAFRREAQPRLQDPAGFLMRGLAACHVAILREAKARDLPETPRTVIAACVVQDGHAYWTHVGDCRFYLLRGAQVVARTRDHTVVQRMVDECRLREDVAAMHPLRNRLLQCLGSYETPRADPPARASLADGDILLLCSDGFWGPLPLPQLVHGLRSRPLEDAIPELAELAEAQAGPQCDNVSALALRWSRT